MKCQRMKSTPEFCKRITVAEFEEQKKKATEEALKQLRETMSKVTIVKKDIPLESVEEDLYSDDDISETQHARKRKREMDKFESENHYLKLDLLNAQTDLNDANEKVASLVKYEKILESYNKLCHNIEENLDKFKANVPSANNPSEVIMMYCSEYKSEFTKTKKQLEEMNMAFLPAHVYIAMLAHVEKLEADWKIEYTKQVNRYALEVTKREFIFAAKASFYASIFLLFIFSVIYSMFNLQDALPN